MKLRLAATAMTVLALAATTAACGGGDSSSGQDSKTLTYWASNQSPSLAEDKTNLAPVLKKFEQQTGIKVKLQVIGWPDLYSKILAATTSGQGPDVLNIGNTWAPSLQATGAFTPFSSKEFDAIGGKDKFVEAAVKTGGAVGKDPTSVPYLGLVYGLYYNKKMFADAGLKPPTTWEELVSDAKKLTQPSKGVYGMAMEGGSSPRACTSPTSSASSTAPTRSPPTARPTSPARAGRGREAVRRPDGREQGGQPQRRAVQERTRGTR